MLACYGPTPIRCLDAKPDFSRAFDALVAIARDDRGYARSAGSWPELTARMEAKRHGYATHLARGLGHVLERLDEAEHGRASRVSAAETAAGGRGGEREPLGHLDPRWTANGTALLEETLGRVVEEERLGEPESNK